MMERSLFSARHCFVENLHDSGNMSDAEFSVLCEWFDFLTGGQLSKIDVGVDLIIYLRTSPEVAYERKKSRARKEEEVGSTMLTGMHNSIKMLFKNLRIVDNIPFKYSLDCTIGIF